MEESPLETSSDVAELESRPEADLQADLLADVIAHRDEILEMLKWNAAIVAILLEQAGGVAEVKREDLERVDLSKVNAVVQFDAERDVYVIKGVYDEDEV